MHYYRPLWTIIAQVLVRLLLFFRSKLTLIDTQGGEKSSIDFSIVSDFLQVLYFQAFFRSRRPADIAVDGAELVTGGTVLFLFCDGGQVGDVVVG